MSDTDETQATEPAAEAPGGPQAPFWVRGSDGSERGPYAELEQAQASKANVEAVHADDKVSFVVADANGEAIS